MSVNYDDVVADLEAKRQAFNAWVDNAIQGIRQIQAALSGLPAQWRGSLANRRRFPTATHPPRSPRS